METYYDKEIRERKAKDLPWKCPDVLHQGVANYQMTCDNCPNHVRQMCKEKKYK